MKYVAIRDELLLQPFHVIICDLEKVILLFPLDEMIKN